MDDLEARELRYFVAVAEELNFSRAAARLGMAQPPLSRAIQQLERRLGSRLFDRDTHRVVLTEFGTAFLDEAQFALSVLTGAGRKAHRAAPETPTLVVTAKPGLATGMLRQIIDAYAQLPGAARVEITVSGYREQADMVCDGRADIALLSSFFDCRGLDVEPLTTQPRVAALPTGHPLARRGRLRCRDLEGEPVPRWPRMTPAEHAYWSGRDHTTAPPIDTPPPGPLVGDPGQLLEVVALGQAVALIPESLAQANPRDDIAYRPVTDASPYTIVIAWSQGSRRQHIAQFVQTATRLHQSQNLAS